MVDQTGGLEGRPLRMVTECTSRNRRLVLDGTYLRDYINDS
jgi:hypothetical protein